ncbi:MAG: hypothetical protein O7G84_13870 [Gammaproteobacteria bacterium]|nr:hypothetical protein [Gammaproteobacteria bacterium]
MAVTTCALPVEAPASDPVAVDIPDAEVPAAPLVEIVLPLEAEDVQAFVIERRGEGPLGVRDAGVLLARMTVSEGTSLQPLREGWELDLQGILQVARITQLRRETLWDSLSRLSPHVAMIEEYTKPRQRWTSTLPARSDGAPSGWTECTTWYRANGRQHGLPKGCNGTWKAGHKNWVTVRDYAINLVLSPDEPPQAVQGYPTTWGGIMDIWTYMERNPHACWLSSPGTAGYFFGKRGVVGNECQEVPERLIKRSKVIDVRIMMRDLKRMRHRESPDG